MTQLPPSDDKPWQEFLRQHRPPPPPPAADVEERLMNAIEKAQLPVLDRRLWAVPPAIAAGLLMAWSGYRALIPLPEPASAASLETFLEDNWNGVMGEVSVSPQSNSPQVEWVVLANTAP